MGQRQHFLTFGEFLEVPVHAKQLLFHAKQLLIHAKHLLFHGLSMVCPRSICTIHCWLRNTVSTSTATLTKEPLIPVQKHIGLMQKNLGCARYRKSKKSRTKR